MGSGSAVHAPYPDVLSSGLDRMTLTGRNNTDGYNSAIHLSAGQPISNSANGASSLNGAPNPGHLYFPPQNSTHVNGTNGANGRKTPDESRDPNGSYNRGPVGGFIRPRQ
jgi:hypothetical protein